MNATMNAVALNAGRPSFSLPDAIHQTADLLARWSRRVADRRSLARLDDFMLRDIGLARGDVEMEIGKPFWRR
jgi:uncharacterized protein YjiS (DUF1127 family)